MKRLKKKVVAGILGGMVMLAALAGIGATSGVVQQDSGVARKVNEYEGQHRIAGQIVYVEARKVNEYEGQH